MELVDPNTGMTPDELDASRIEQRAAKKLGKRARRQKQARLANMSWKKVELPGNVMFDFSAEGFGGLEAGGDAWADGDAWANGDAWADGSAPLIVAPPPPPPVSCRNASCRRAADRARGAERA